MRQCPVGGDPDVVSDERLPAAENDRVRVEGHVRYSKVWGEGGSPVSGLSIEHINQMVLGIEPPVVEDDAEEPMRHRHPRKEVIVGGTVIVHSDRLAPSGTSVEAPAG